MLLLFLILDFLSEDGGLAPADRLWWRKSILVNDAEVALGLVFHFTRWMALETEQYLEKDTDQSGMHG
jgi:hypothetical protein